jgi:hypothetical protein
MIGCKGNVKVFWKRCCGVYETKNRQTCRQRLEKITNLENHRER